MKNDHPTIDWCGRASKYVVALAQKCADKRKDVYAAHRLFHKLCPSNAVGKHAIIFFPSEAQEARWDKALQKKEAKLNRKRARMDREQRLAEAKTGTVGR